MRLNLESQSYGDAIFYADKIVNLIRSKEVVSNTNAGQAAAPAGGSEKTDSHGKSQGKENQGLNGGAGKSAGQNVSEAAASALYDLAYCY